MITVEDTPQKKKSTHDYFYPPPPSLAVREHLFLVLRGRYPTWLFIADFIQAFGLDPDEILELMAAHEQAGAVIHRYGANRGHRWQAKAGVRLQK